MKKKILIIGSNSFAASSLINYLLNQKYHIVGISRSREIISQYCPYKTNLNFKNFSFIQMDINKHHNSLINIIKKNKFETIIDFAGQGMVAESWLKPDQWYQTNIVSKTKLYHSLRPLKFIKKIIKISTPEVYGSKKRKIKTNDIYNPSTPYAVSHASIDTTMKLFREQFGMPIIITRFANFYGPYQPLYRLIPKAIHYFSKKQIFEIHGDGKSVRSFIHSNDFSNAIHKIIQRKINRNIYHFSGDKNYTIISILKIISNQMNIQLNDNIKYVSDRVGKDHKYIMDDSDSKSFLNWKNKTNIETGITDCINWYNNFNASLNKSKSIYIHKA